MIILFFGPVASGKSTIARMVAERLPGSYVLTSDMFRRRTYSRLIREVARLKDTYRYLIVDGTFYKRRWREELRKAVRGTPMLEAYVHCSLETCLRRNRERGSPVPERAVRIVWSEFEPPEMPDVEVDTDRLNAEQAALVVLSLVRAFSTLGGRSAKSWTAGSRWPSPSGLLV